MLMKILWPTEHGNTTCKSIWGTDPYFVSPDLAPHARFVTPQCGRLIQGKTINLGLRVLIVAESTSEASSPKNSSCETTLFFAVRLKFHAGGTA